MAVDKMIGTESKSAYHAHCEIGGCGWSEEHATESAAVKALNVHYNEAHIKKMIENGE